MEFFLGTKVFNLNFANDILKLNKKICLEEEKSNLLKNNKDIQTFQLMNILYRESINLFEQLKERKNYEEYIELRKKIFNFLKSDKELINLDIYKLLEEMVTLKEKIVIELQKYN